MVGLGDIDVWPLDELRIASPRRRDVRVRVQQSWQHRVGIGRQVQNHEDRGVDPGREALENDLQGRQPARGSADNDDIAAAFVSICRHAGAEGARIAPGP